MTIAMQQNTCTKNAIDLKHMVVVAFHINENDVHEQTDLMSKLMTCSKYQFDLIEADLNRHHESQKVQHAMKILRQMKLWNNDPSGTNDGINNARVSSASFSCLHIDSQFQLFQSLSIFAGCCPHVCVKWLEKWMSDQGQLFY